MRSLYLRVVITFTVTLILSLVAALWISGSIMRRANHNFLDGSMNLELQQAERIYTSQGSQSLGEYLAETDQALRGKRYLTDKSGRDVLSDADLSAMLSVEFNFLGFPKAKNGQLVLVKSSPDGQYRLVIVVPPPLGVWPFLPFFLLVVLATSLLGWALSVGIVSPLRHMAQTVDRFGRGDLSARVRDDRKDEIGNLSQSFNSMAERIEILLTAERRLLQDVSHELRSPLARLSFAAELMRDSPDVEGATALMRREIERLSQLVSTLVEVTSSEGDLNPHKSQRLLIADLVKDIVADCALEADARAVRLHTEIDHTPALEGDPELLRRAVENVVRNAVRFAPPNSCVSVRVKHHDGHVAVRIRDYGPGVPEEFLTRIFDPFFHVDESRNDMGAGGMGLGLSIARRAIQLHHGAITAQNAVPGLQVTITVPSAR